MQRYERRFVASDWLFTAATTTAQSQFPLSTSGMRVKSSSAFDDPKTIAAAGSASAAATAGIAGIAAACAIVRQSADPFAAAAVSFNVVLPSFLPSFLPSTCATAAPSLPPSLPPSLSRLASIVREIVTRCQSAGLSLSFSPLGPSPPMRLHSSPLRPRPSLELCRKRDFVVNSRFCRTNSMGSLPGLSFAGLTYGVGLHSLGLPLKALLVRSHMGG